MGGAAEAAFNRKLRRYQREIRELQRAGITFRPMVWAADGRPHPAVTRTLKYAAEIAATRNTQQASAPMILGRWRHEIQIAILRRRAAMCRAVLPRPSRFEHWLLTGEADRSAGAEGRAAALGEDGLSLAGEADVPDVAADATEDIGGAVRDEDLQK